MPINFKTGKVTNSKRMNDVLKELSTHKTAKYITGVVDFENCILRYDKRYHFEISSVDKNKRKNKTVNIYVHDWEGRFHIPFSIFRVPDENIHEAIDLWYEQQSNVLNNDELPDNFSRSLEWQENGFVQIGGD